MAIITNAVAPNRNKAPKVIIIILDRTPATLHSYLKNTKLQKGKKITRMKDFETKKKKAL